MSSDSGLASVLRATTEDVGTLRLVSWDSRQLRLGKTEGGSRRLRLGKTKGGSGRLRLEMTEGVGSRQLRLEKTEGVGSRQLSGREDLVLPSEVSLSSRQWLLLPPKRRLSCRGLWLGSSSYHDSTETY